MILIRRILRADDVATWIGTSEASDQRSWSNVAAKRVAGRPVAARDGSCRFPTHSLPLNKKAICATTKSASSPSGERCSRISTSDFNRYPCVAKVPYPFSALQLNH
jgi:hypothetical protein